jgi:hypothetical protein
MNFLPPNIMESSLETSLETLNITGQQQPSIPHLSSGDDIEKILAEFTVYADNTIGAVPGSFDPNNNNEQLDINALINSSNDSIDHSTLLQTQFSEISIDSDILDILESFQKQEPLEYEPSSLPQQSTFIEHYEPTNFYQSQPAYSSPLSVPVGSSPVEPKATDNSLYTQAYLNQQDQIYQEAKKSKKRRTHQQQRSTNVGPVDYIMHSGGCQPCTTAQMQTDVAYQQQLLEYDAADSKQIQILCQPRSQFRPRTQNESKNSSHYLRCKEDVKPEYPTISIPQTWFFNPMLI